MLSTKYPVPYGTDRRFRVRIRRGWAAWLGCWLTRRGAVVLLGEMAVVRGRNMERFLGLGRERSVEVEWERGRMQCIEILWIWN